MTAHWGIPDPAAATGTPTEIALAFNDAYRMLHRRIEAFAALPIRALDALTLQGKLREIGRMAGATSQGNHVTGTLARRAVAEFLGTALLLATVVGSGIMGAKLAGGNVALALLGNTLPTGAILVVLILIFGPVSGAHFNPAVTLAFVSRARAPRCRSRSSISPRKSPARIAGAWMAHLMFELPVLQLSSTARTGGGAMARGGGRDLRPAADDLRLPRGRAAPRSPTRSASTSRRPTGSPPRPRSPIRR